MRLFRSASLIGFFTILSRLAGLVREILQAHFIGQGMVMDALNYAMTFPSFFRRLFAEGAFNASFVPIFAGTLAQDGKAQARIFANQCLTLLLIPLVLITFTVELWAEPLFSKIFSGFSSDTERLSLTIYFMRITFPFLFFISLTAFFSGVLNSFERFAAAASSPLVGNIGIILLLVGFSLQGFSSDRVLSWAIFLCGFLQLVWVWVPSHFKCLRIRLAWPTLSPSMRSFLRRLLPAALGSGIYQINLMVDMILSSYLQVGSYSSLKYAERFNQLPLSVIGTAISTALLPLLSRQIRQQKWSKVFTVQNRSLEFSLFLTVPAAVGLMCIAPLLIEVFYHHGKFTAEAVLPTAYTLVALASGLPAYVLIKIFSTTFFARGDTRMPIIIASVGVGINFLLNVFFIYYCHFEQIGMGLATSISSWLNMVALFYFLWRRKHYQFDAHLKKNIQKIIFSGLVLAFFMMGYRIFLLDSLQKLCCYQSIQLCVFIIVSLFVYFISAHQTGILTLSSIYKNFKEPNE